MTSGCAGPWDVDALEAREPGLARVAAHRLGDTQPYLLPRDGTLLWFLCRWETADPLRIGFDASLEPRERELVERALAAWQQALPALRWSASEPAEADLVVAVESVGPGFSGQTAADCAVALAPDAPLPPDVVPARLVRARVALRRSSRDARGHEMALSEEELLGAALHEIGHALGFQGHARRGDTVMRRDVDTVRRAGRRVLAGQPFHDVALAALYEVPSGVRVRTAQVGSARTAAVDAVARRARREGLAGPFVRVGDRSGRIAWQAGGLQVALWLPELGDVLRNPQRLSVLPDPDAARWLRSRSASETAPGSGSAEPRVE